MEKRLKVLEALNLFVKNRHFLIPVEFYFLLRGDLVFDLLFVLLLAFLTTVLGLLRANETLVKGIFVFELIDSLVSKLLLTLDMILTRPKATHL